MNIDEAQYLIIVILSVIAVVTGGLVAYRWRGKYIPVNYLFFVVFALVSAVIGHYYLALLLRTTDPTRIHVSIFGIRVARLIAVEVLIAVSFLNFVSLTYRSRYHKRLRELQEEEKYREEIKNAIIRAVEAKETADQAR